MDFSNKCESQNNRYYPQIDSFYGEKGLFTIKTVNLGGASVKLRFEDHFDLVYNKEFCVIHTNEKMNEKKTGNLEN